MCTRHRGRRSCGCAGTPGLLEYLRERGDRARARVSRIDLGQLQRRTAAVPTKGDLRCRHPGPPEHRPGAPRTVSIGHPHPCLAMIRAQQRFCRGVREWWRRARTVPGAVAGQVPSPGLVVIDSSSTCAVSERTQGVDPHSASDRRSGCGALGSCRPDPVLGVVAGDERNTASVPGNGRRWSAKRML